MKESLDVTSQNRREARLGLNRIVLLAALLAAAGSAVVAQDANELLRRAADAHRKLHSFEASGVLTARIHRAGVDYDVRWPVSMAQADSTRLPAGSPVPALSQLLNFGQPEIHDGAGKRAAAFDPLPSPRGWSVFEQIDQHVREVRLLPDAAVETGGKTVSCRVLEVHYEAGFPSRALSGERVRYWIDPTSFRVLGVSFTARASGGREAVHWTFTAHTLKTNEPPPPWAVQMLPQLAGNEREEWRGRRAPEFTLKDLEGREVRLAALRGNTVLLSFWASWCAPCKEEIPLLERLRAEWEPQGLKVWGITNESAEKARAWLDEQRFDLPTLVDEDRRVFGDYEVGQIPVSVVVDRHGNVVSYLQGLGGEAHFRAAIERALAK